MTENKTYWERVIQLQKQRVHAPVSDKEAYRLRKDRLERLKNMIENHVEEWLEALYQDLKKPPTEAYVSELMVLLNELDAQLDQLKMWMKPVKQHHVHLASQATVTLERLPYGSVLILAPWNYPLQLSLIPLAGALAAGNACVLKPSESAPAVSRLLAKRIAEVFDPTEVLVVEGEADTSRQLVACEWDHIFFTGSPEIGRQVYASAAERLIPVTLELGGKNPCIVDESGCTTANIRKILWGKFLNAGQTCVAPDTVYVQADQYEHFLAQSKQILQEFYGINPIDSADYGRIIHDRHFDKLTEYLEDGTVYYGGRGKKEALFFEPTLLVDPVENSLVRTEEIFGPVLVVLPYTHLEEVVLELADQPAPLVSYVFTEDRVTAEYLYRTLKSGAISRNQVVFQAARADIPFGGVGESGFGRYHGKASFDTFTYVRPLYEEKAPFPLKEGYPPYRPNQWQMLQKIRKWLF